MRNLTITRRKRFVASLGTMMVYIEDPASEELHINGIPCRKLGNLRNGETVTFPIGTEARKVFVIGDKLSRNLSNEFFPIPAGETDVSLSGENKLNPGAGNPFCFDGISDETVMANRKKRSARGILILVVAFFIGVLGGKHLMSFLLNGVLNNSDPKEFTSHGMSIVLTEAFEQRSYDGYTVCYESNDAVVFALQEAFTLMPGLENYSLEEYGDLVFM